MAGCDSDGDSESIFRDSTLLRFVSFFCFSLRNFWRFRARDSGNRAIRDSRFCATKAMTVPARETPGKNPVRFFTGPPSPAPSGWSRKSTARRPPKQHFFVALIPFPCFSPYPKDPSVLKIVRRSNPHYFATAVVFLSIRTVFLSLFPRKNKHF